MKFELSKSLSSNSFKAIFIASITALACLCHAGMGDEPLTLGERLLSLHQTSNDANQLPTSSYTNIFTGDRGDKNVYNAQLLGITALVASDDTGLRRTFYASRGGSLYKTSSQISKLGNGEYVLPALGALYLSGGNTNQRIAYHSLIAIAKAGAVGELAKTMIGRHRPDRISGGSDATTFKPFSTSNTYNSFPSGHTLVAFSVAGVWAHEKPRDKYAAYGLAGLVGLSRLTLSAHWSSDVLAGAVLGLSQARQANNGGKLCEINF
jgi:membrane-associated phospholipid phosphatase